MSEAAYERLRELNKHHGLGNNYLLTVLLENLDTYCDQAKLETVFAEFISEYGSPQKRKKEAKNK
ncbi:MAG: hypothetical protein WBC71_02600 [Salaquimonas sp.]